MYACTMYMYMYGWCSDLSIFHAQVLDKFIGDTSGAVLLMEVCSEGWFVCTYIHCTCVYINVLCELKEVK